VIDLEGISGELMDDSDAQKKSSKSASGGPRETKEGPLVSRSRRGGGGDSRMDVGRRGGGKGGRAGGTNSRVGSGDDDVNSEV
jgi:hypothetical protein